MSNNKLQKIEQLLEAIVIEDKSDITLVTKAVFKNFIGLIPIPGVGNTISAAMDYYEAKVNKRREEEVNSCLSKIEKKLDSIIIKQEAIDYFENSLIFRYEVIMQKLLSNPGKGFDEILAEFVATSLYDLETQPNTKDLILSSLLSIDSVDIKVLIQIDKQFKHLLDSGKTRGASFADIVTLMKPEQIDEILISRSIQRLQSQDLIHPLNNNNASIQELPAQRELLKGVKSPQYYSQGGFVISAFGRKFIQFLKLN